MNKILTTKCRLPGGLHLVIHKTNIPVIMTRQLQSCSQYPPAAAHPPPTEVFKRGAAPLPVSFPFPYWGSCLKCHSEERVSRSPERSEGDEESPSICHCEEHRDEAIWEWSRGFKNSPHRPRTLRYAQGDVDAVLLGQSP